VVRAIARRAHGRFVTVIAAVIFAIAVSVNRYATAVTARQFGQPAGATATATANIAATTLATPAHCTADAAAVRRVRDQQQQQRDDSDDQRPKLLPVTLVESSSGISYLLFNEKTI